jgi:hypothetical protein
LPGSSTWRASGGCRITIPISGKPSASGTSAKAPYLTLPIFGPSDARDAVGLLVGFATNPLTWMSGTSVLVAGFGRAGTQGVDERARNIDTLDSPAQLARLLRHLAQRLSPAPRGHARHSP